MDRRVFACRRLARSLEAIGLYQAGAVNVSDPRGGGEPQRMSSAFVTPSVIPLLQVSPSSVAPSPRPRMCRERA